MPTDLTGSERVAWLAAYGSAYAIHALVNGYDDTKADHYARNVAIRCVWKFREGT